MRVPWSLATSRTGRQASPDIAGIIEEIVARSDWRPGNALGLLVDPATAGETHYGTWHACDGSPVNAARLVVSYELLATVTPTPTATASPTPTATPTPTAPPVPAPGWQPLGSGMNGIVRALAVGLDGSLYAGGAFTTTGGVTANYVARWDGATAAWQALGSGMDGAVAALAVGPDGAVYAGGGFTAAGGVAASHVARWDGTTWQALGGGFDGDVAALAVGPDGAVYAGGEFTTAGGVTANHVARWDGATAAWQALGSGMDGAVQALAVGPDGEVYAGGAFTTAGGVTANYVARWDGATAAWQALGSGTNDAVQALAVGPDGSVYAGGGFTSAGGVTANSVARWDGAAWRFLGSGVARSEWGDHRAIAALVTAPDGSLYVGGDFEVAGSVTAPGVARWHRSTASWQPLGSGLCDFFVYDPDNLGKCNVFALAVAPDGSPYAGGTSPAPAGWRPTTSRSGSGV